MKRVFLLSILFAVLFTSCNMGMLGQYSDYYYYSPNKNTGGSSGGDSGPGEDIEIPDIDVDPEKDPFIKGEWNKPDYKFDGTKFETWLLKVSFDGSNIPEYGFFEDGTQWTESHVKEGYPEVSFNADNRGWTAQGITMKPLTIYRYNHKNPLVAADGAYNTSDRLDRFFFYRIIGAAKVAGIGANLDQYLIAVDSYSKFVFAYAKVISTESVMGNAVPNGFGPVENFGEKRFFYECDPIGYVKESGELVLYQEYRDAMLATKSIGFFPAIKDPTRPMASENGPGRSPYYVDSIDNVDPEALKDMFKGKTYSIRDVNNSLILYTYAISEDGNTLTITQTHYYDGVMDEPQVFTNPEVIGLSSLKFGEKNIVGLEKTDTGFAKLKDGDTELELILDYQDPGPNFYDRVKNAVFRYDSHKDRAYLFFSLDGKTLTDMSDGKVYVYSSNGYATATYTYDGTKYKLELSNEDKTLKWIDWEYVGWGYYPSSRIGSFTDALNDTSWYYRDYSDYKFRGTEHIDNVAPGYKSTGISKTLHTYTFKGSTLEYVQTVYREAGEKVRKSYNFVSADGPVGTYTDGTGAKVTVTVKHNSIVVSENGKNYEYSKTDYGPIFVDRVAGAVFLKGNIRYEFSEDGLSFDFWYNSNFSKPADEHYTFARFDNSMENHNKAVYYHYKFAGINYWPVQFTKDNDDVIYKSSGAGAIGTPGTGTILGNPADRQP